MSGPADATRRASSTACASSMASPIASRTSARGAPRPWLNRQATITEAALDRAAAASEWCPPVRRARHLLGSSAHWSRTGG